MNETVDQTSIETDETQDRRGVLKQILIAGGALVLSTATRVLAADTPPHETPGGDSTKRTIPVTESVPTGAKSDILIRMREELRKAMAKPMEQRKWTMLIDTRKCVGCHACTVGCIAENMLPPGVVYRPVHTEDSGSYPNLKSRFIAQPCMHCDKPSCVPVCPADATWKRPDNVVAIDYDRCIGCGNCVEACPYHHRSVDEGKFFTKGTPAVQPYELLSSHEYGKSWNRSDGKSPVNNARKCHFCLHRLNEGELPMCVTTCIGRATYFGDSNDPDSMIAAQLRETNQMKLLEDKGTQPTVVYLV